MKILSFIIALLVFTAARSQDLSAEMSSMYAKLDELSSYRITVDYAAGDTADLFEKGEVSTLVAKEGYFYDAGFAEMVINAEHTIIINEEERTIIYSDNRLLKDKELASKNNLLDGINAFVASADSVYFALNGSDRTYYLRLKEGYFNLIEITFRGSYISKMVCYYREEMVEEQGLSSVCNLLVEENPEYNTSSLMSEFYFTRKDEEAVPAELFSGYQLIYNPSTELK